MSASLNQLLTTIPKDILHKIAGLALKGSLLISFCDNIRLEADKFNLFCFVLSKEFGFKWRASLYGYQNPRDLYKQMYTTFFWASAWYRDGSPKAICVRGEWAFYRPAGDGYNPVFIVPGPNDNPLLMPKKGARGINILYNVTCSEFSFAFDSKSGIIFGAEILFEKLTEKNHGAVYELINEMKDRKNEFSKVPPTDFRSEILEKYFPGKSDFKARDVPLKGGSYYI